MTAGGRESRLIRRHFQDLTASRAGVIRGVGDDAAVLEPGDGEWLAAACDTLVEGVHFPEDAPPEALGHRVLAVNLSDLAAMGARPRWVLLSVTLPELDDAWLEEFSRGLAQLADRHEVALVGGDTTQGPRSMTVQVLGALPRGEVLTRGGAAVGDGIYVTGSVGDAALGLRCWSQRRGTPTGDAALAVARFLRPEPRVTAGLVLREYASAAIDVSDGLAIDLARVLEESGVGGTVELHALPRSAYFRRLGGTLEDALYGGDDYELCFTLPPEAGEGAVQELAAWGIAATRIGTVDATPGLRQRDAQGSVSALEVRGYDHFSATGQA